MRRVNTASSDGQSNIIDYCLDLEDITDLYGYFIAAYPKCSTKLNVFYSKLATQLNTQMDVLKSTIKQGFKTANVFESDLDPRIYRREFDTAIRLSLNHINYDFLYCLLPCFMVWGIMEDPEFRQGAFRYVPQFQSKGTAGYGAVAASAPVTAQKISESRLIHLVVLFYLFCFFMLTEDEPENKNRIIAQQLFFEVAEHACIETQTDSASQVLAIMTAANKKYNITGVLKGNSRLKKLFELIDKFLKEQQKSELPSLEFKNPAFVGFE